MMQICPSTQAASSQFCPAQQLILCSKFVRIQRFQFGMDKLIPQAANHAELAEVMTAVHVLADKIDRPFLHRAGDTGLTVPEIIKDGLPIRCPGSRPVGHMILRQLDQQTFQEIECRENRGSGIRSLRQGWGFCGSSLRWTPAPGWRRVFCVVQQLEGIRWALRITSGTPASALSMAVLQ